MTVLRIRRLPDDMILRQKAKKVSRIDVSIQRLIDDMIETMQLADGVGLAAPQAGVLLRVIVVQMPGENTIAIINPEIINRSGEQKVTEGCLSVPGYYGELKRSAEVTLKGKDRKGRPIKIKANALLAEALEHEVDHLDGILYIDRIQSQDMLYKVQPRVITEEGNKPISDCISKQGKTAAE